MTTFFRVAAIYLIIFAQMLDTSVTNLSLNNIASDLHINILQSAWIMTSFGVGLVIAFPSGTLLSKYISSDSVLLLGGCIFIYSSIGCGVAPEEYTFLLSRFLQGLGSGMTLVVAQSLMLRIMGNDKRAFSISLWSSAISIAPVFGPVVGAYVTQTLGWRWLFLLNVPLIGSSIFILLPYLNIEALKNPVESTKRQLLTFILFAGMISSLQFVLDFGERLRWLNSEAILIGIAIFIFFFIVFFYFNYKKQFQIYSFNVFKDSRFTIATIVLTVANGLVYSSIVLLPLWLKVEYNMPILIAGLIVSLGSGVAAIASPFIGKLVPARLLGPLGVLSLFFGFISFSLMSFITIDSSPVYIAMTRLVAGAGLSIMTMPLLTYSMSRLPTEMLINANAVSLTIRITFANLFVTVVFIAYQHLTLYKQTMFVASLDVSSIINHNLALASQVYVLVKPQFATGAMQTIFLFAATAFFLGSIAVIWSLRKAERLKPVLK